MRSFPFYKQLDSKDCGPSCLRMVAAFYGKVYSLQMLREHSYIARFGVSLLGLSDAAETIGLRTLGANITFDKLGRDAPLPAIVHWKQNHFVVVYKITKRSVTIADPGVGVVRLSHDDFRRYWLKARKGDTGAVLLLEPTPDFYLHDDERHLDKTRFAYIFSYLLPYKRYIVQLILGLMVGSLLQLFFPFLTQAIVDIGINQQDIGFVNLVLAGQLVLIISRTTVDFTRGWILLHLGTRINISIIADFLVKLMKLPVSFFDRKMIGDILQRISDHKRIETFLTSSTLNILFSFFNIIVFSIILIYYDLQVFLVFLIGSSFYVVWILLFMKKRRELDYWTFDRMSENQSTLVELIHGMQEIKLHNSEKQKRWNWERIQAKLFRLRSKGLALSQYQQSGTVFINEVKNILIVFISARSVIEGDITLGMMLAIQYITGQLNAPIMELINFIRSVQDAKISLERLGEVHLMDNEEEDEKIQARELPSDQALTLENVRFQYEGPHSEYVLDDINLRIPQGETTAIVGASGSGKTTLVKLLLKFYKPTHGEIRLGRFALDEISSHAWRKKCGAVMQAGYIFNETIAGNIALGHEVIDHERLIYAADVASILEYIDTLPLGFNTKLGGGGQKLSQGQEQRMLIARAVYKDPDYIFFDEATNALDATNESAIMRNLQKFLSGKTVVVVAHRLSTVKNADNIVVLGAGKIIESGTHDELIARRGAYFDLVSDQLALGV